jgi:SAM-dependent methyltransferase
MSRCYLCGSESLEPLTVPGAGSVTTDGQLLSVPLRKYQCLACNLLQSDPQTILDSTAFSYEENYDFYGRPEMRAFERERYRNYANWVASFIERSPVQSVLEVGCGAGWVLELLQEAHGSKSLRGLEPSAGATRRAIEAGLAVEQGSLEQAAFSPGTFDFAYSINVLEHVPDPRSFLVQMRRLVKPDGAVLIICPCANVIDTELLFADHLYSYSRLNLERLAEEAGLAPAAWQQGAGTPFQAMYLRPAPLHAPMDAAAPDAWWCPDEQLVPRRREFFQRWAGMDATLLGRMGASGEVVCFGAGETKDLLRAYTPESWARVGSIMIDRPQGVAVEAQAQTAGEMPVRFVDEYHANERPSVLMGVKPRYQAAISDRLTRLASSVIRWDDVVPEPFR